MNVSLAEVECKWNFEDIMQAHEVLDVIDELEREAWRQ